AEEEDRAEEETGSESAATERKEDAGDPTRGRERESRRVVRRGRHLAQHREHEEIRHRREREGGDQRAGREPAEGTALKTRRAHETEPPERGRRGERNREEGGERAAPGEL